VQVVNAAVSGGAGSNAKAILASRLLAGDPPDSYQRHAGLELADDVRSGKVADLTSLYAEQGWTKVLPQGLLDKLRIDGQLYAVPVNIHPANLIWYRPATLRKLGIVGPPRSWSWSWSWSWSEFLQQAATIRAKGLTPPTRRPELDPEAPAGDGTAGVSWARTGTRTCGRVPPRGVVRKPLRR